MRLVRIRRLRWEIVAIARGEDCPVIRFLSEQSLDHGPAVRWLWFRMRSLFAERSPRRGHAAKHLREGIWEWKRRRLRLLWFEDLERGRAVVTHGFLKDRAKVPACEIERALRLRSEYHAMAERDLVIVEFETWEQ